MSVWKTENEEDYTYRRQADGTAASRALCRFPEKKGGAPEFRKIRQDIHYDRRCPGAHGQR